MTTHDRHAGDQNDGLRPRLAVSPQVREALETGRPVVALESTLISHGLPYPANVEVARASEAAVREGGAVAATIAIRDGRILVGLDDDSLVSLGTEPAGSVLKAARPNLAVALARNGWAATTVSATMIAARAAGIRVFATGGIGGVHVGAFGSARGGATIDVSSDLEELARTPLVVVCAGPKNILDVPKTLEYLETHGVPVVAVGQDELPGFTARSSGIPAPSSVPDLAGAVALARLHLSLALGSALVLCVPVPADVALPDDLAHSLVARAIADAEASDVGGPALTPWLLARIAELSNGASVRANTALIVNDARFAGRIAASLAERTEPKRVPR